MNARTGPAGGIGVTSSPNIATTSASSRVW
jgi:hypothetical protein